MPVLGDFSGTGSRRGITGAPGAIRIALTALKQRTKVERIVGIALRPFDPRTQARRSPQISSVGYARFAAQWGGCAGGQSGTVC
jgi:hypothetical protein